MRFLHIPNFIAIGLVIVGGVRLSSNDPLQQKSGKLFAQTGLTVFMAVFGVYSYICLVTLLGLDVVAGGERRILFGVLTAIPFLFLRILYAMIAVFKDNNKFAIVNGSATVELCMAIIMEMVVVVFYCGTGLLAPTEKEIKRRKEEQRLQSVATT